MSDMHQPIEPTTAPSDDQQMASEFTTHVGDITGLDAYFDAIVNSIETGSLQIDNEMEPPVMNEQGYVEPTFADHEAAWDRGRRSFK